MPSPTFTENSDLYDVVTTDDHTLHFLGGNDRLEVEVGATVIAHLGEGSDSALLTAGDGEIYGDAGNDRIDFYVGGYTARGGTGNDTFNIEAGNNLTL